MITFADALAESEANRRYLLIGNGFSISLFPHCFSYSSLYKTAIDEGLFDSAPELTAAFDALGTIDFEAVMNALKASVSLGPIYGYDVVKMSEHAELLKSILVQAIAGRHPDRPNTITEEQYRNCRAFLANFIGIARGANSQGKVFTLNYDLLLYWSVLHDIFELSEIDVDGFEIKVDQLLRHDDGFRLPEDDFDAEYVAWEQFSASHNQCITYLHGALHLYERGPELAKLCWERSGNKPLMDQIHSALDEDKYPLFVSEGSSAQKLSRINRSAYLSKGLRSFSECCNKIAGSIFVIGHSLAENDDHILRRITKGKIRNLYVSIFGDPNSDSNQVIQARAQAMVAARGDAHPLVLRFVDATTVHVWDHPAP